MLYLYNEYFSFLPRLKNFLGKSARGPEAVFNSLVKGLSGLKQDFKVNAPGSQPIETACVLSGIKTLAWAINQKQAGKITQIIVGPNIVVTPNDANGILKSSAIDKIIVPSPWVKDFYISLAPELASKIHIWAAGVSDHGQLANPNGRMFLFYKSGDFNLVDKAYQLGKVLNLKPSTIFYGQFKHSDYISMLKDARVLVYVSESESQGLVLHEAWMAGVPTLVWDRGRFTYKNYKFEAACISAPYLTPDCGLFFKGQEDLTTQLKNLLDNYYSFSPRQYSLRNFTHKICAQKYLQIINS